MRRECDLGSFAVQIKFDVDFLLCHGLISLRLCVLAVTITSRKGAQTQSHAPAPDASCFLALPKTMLSISLVFPINTAAEIKAGRSPSSPNTSKVSASFTLT